MCYQLNHTASLWYLSLKEYNIQRTRLINRGLTAEALTRFTISVFLDNGDETFTEHANQTKKEPFSTPPKNHTLKLL
jgi:hypothetical protein